MKNNYPNDFPDCVDRTSIDDGTTGAWHCWDTQRGCCFPGLALAPLSSHLCPMGQLAMTSLILDLRSYLPASMIDSQYIEEGNINMFLFPGSPLVVSHGFTEHWPRGPLPFPNLLWV